MNNNEFDLPGIVPMEYKVEDDSYVEPIKLKVDYMYHLRNVQTKAVSNKLCMHMRIDLEKT